MVLFSYRVVPNGDHRGQVLATGSLYITDVESAKRHVQTVTAHNVVAEPGMEVILLDHLGPEIWRGPYLGRDGAATLGETAT